MNITTPTSPTCKKDNKAAFFVKSGSPKTAKGTIKMLLSFWFNLFA